MPRVNAPVAANPTSPANILDILNRVQEQTKNRIQIPPPPVQPVVKQTPSNQLKNKKTYKLQASKATNYFNGLKYSNLNFYIPGFLSATNPHVSKKTISISYAYFPASFYLIESSVNDNLQLIFNSISYTFTIPAGNYSYTSFITWWVTYVYPTCAINLVYNTSTGVFSMNAVSPFTILGSSTCDIVIGIQNNQNIVATLISSTYSLTMPQIANFLGPTDLSVQTSNIGVQNYNSLDSGYYLFSIPCTAVAFGVNYYQSTLTEHEFSIPLQCTDDNFSIVIYDNFGNYVNFKGIDWGIEITLTEYYSTIDPKNQHTFNYGFGFQPQQNQQNEQQREPIRNEELNGTNPVGNNNNELPRNEQRVDRVKRVRRTPVRRLSRRIAARNRRIKR
ncbi:MAG: hypothetical protein KGJ07_03985 [Patescibacteria group bacterium]|nr:hypothetical protein [Patescibacteria group bacterium]